MMLSQVTTEVTVNPAIHISEVSKRFSDVIAVNRLSLDIFRGEIFGLLGPNGAGKSTLVNMLCGVTSIDIGDIEILGHSVKHRLQAQAAKLHLGVVPQEIALFDHLTVMDNLNFFAALYNLKGAVKRERISEALELAQLVDKSKKKVRTLSGGMRRRLNLACSILHNPTILVLDEPTVGIDPQSRNHIFDTIRKLNTERGMTIIYITHYMEEVEQLCDRLAIIDAGKILIKGTKQMIVESVSDEWVVKLNAESITEAQLYEIKRIDGIRHIEVGETEIHMVIQKNKVSFDLLTATLSQIGIKIMSMSMEMPSLESAFLSITGKSLRDA